MYTIKEASARSGVGIPLLRAWERRYRVVEPMRTGSGYRLYDDEAIARLIAMRQLIDAGWAPQQAAARIRAADAGELADLASDAARPPRVEVGAAVAAGPAPRDLLIERIVEAAGRLDPAQLERALDETFALVRFETAWDAVLLPALRRIGDGWHRGEISVAGEHATSQAIHRRLAMAFEGAGPAPSGPAVLVGLPPGARHEFAALAFATAVRRTGLPVLYLGPDLPAESWVSAAADRNAPAVVIGVPRRADADRAREVVTALRRERPEVRIFVGGGHADRVAGAHATALPSASLVESVAELARALGWTHRSPGSAHT
ncbi:MAG TPA: cobalamin B12-binding domain-containing protein [candidate division Zixibacteria bacterium]|nr:cobalamin B12-binding domain-containing protein [candidate division Zixibacteria bacterium]